MGEIDFSDSGSQPIEKPLDEWNHRDFLKYWDYKYRLFIHPVCPRRSPDDNMKLKAAITSSIKKYGQKTLRDMVDYAFENHSDYPSWNMGSSLLVFAAHGWSRMILERVQSRQETSIEQDDALEEMLK